jgi:hypothetical protein
MSRTLYRVTLTPVPGWDVPPLIRLRSALKSFLRSYGLRCRRVEEIREDEAGEAAAGHQGEESAR